MVWIFIPSFEEGTPRRSNNGTLPQSIGAAGEVKHPSKYVSDLPGCAVTKVACHLLEQRNHPSFEEGNKNPPLVSSPSKGGDFRFSLHPFQELFRAVPTCVKT